MNAILLRAFRLTAWIGCFSFTVKAHNLDTRATAIDFAKDYVQTMSTRAGLNQPLVQIGDEFWVVIKTTPGPGTETGVGGYQTFYVPNGMQVVGAAYVLPTPDTATGFTQIPMKGQSPIAIGAGPNGVGASTGLVGFTYPSPNILGVNEAPVTASGGSRGTIAGVYADTGIFYSTDPRTVFNSYGASLSGGTPPMTNNSGDTVGEWDAANVAASDVLGVMTLWDSYQLRAFGRKDVAPIIDPDGRGNSPWGLASAVAGPQSGYQWSFNAAAYTNTASIPGAIETGPWNRIKYPGSQISKDQAGLISSTIGYAGVDGSSIGYDFSSGPLPTNVNAVRFAIGQLEFGRSEYSAVKLKINSLPSSSNLTMYADAFGGDAGGTSNGKDHLWRYFDPTVVTLNPATTLQKVARDPLISLNQETAFDITFANLGSVALPNVVLSDVLPSGLSYVGATPVPNTVSGSNLSWNLGTVNPGQIRTLTVFVRGTTTGIHLNTVTATSNGNPLATAYDTVEVNNRSVLQKSKTVTPSTVAPGGTVTYTISIINYGTSPNGLPMQIADYLPPGFTYDSFVSATVNGASFTPTIDASNTTRPRFTVNQSILPDRALTIKFVARTSNSISAGTYFNETEVLYEGKILSPIPEAPVTVGGARIGDFVWRDWNNNGVQDSGEEGISGVTVRLFASNGTTLLQTTSTDANGQYLFTGLTANTYVVKVTAPINHLQTYDPDVTVNNETTVVLGANQNFLTADFGYRFNPASPTAAQIGDLVFADNNNNAGNEEGEPGIPGVTVWLYEDTNGNGAIDSVDLLIGTTVTADGTTDVDGDAEIDPEGFYYFAGLDPDLNYITKVDKTDGELTLFFDPNPFVLSTAETRAISAALLPDGARYDLADFGFFGITPAVVGDTLFIDNNTNGVFDAGDAPLANISVQIYLDLNGNNVADSGELYDTRTTNSLGVYEFNDLGPGKYIVKVLASDPDLPVNAVGTIAQHELTLTAGQTLLTADFPYIRYLTKSVDKAYEVADGILTYTLNPYIPGSASVTGVTVTDATPAGTTFQGGDLPTAASKPAIGSTGNVIWNLGSTTPAAPGAGATPGYTPTSIVRQTTGEVDDTYIQEDGGGNDNYGTANTILTRPEATKRKAALMRFTLPSLASSDVIDRAYIRVMITGARSNTSVTMRRMNTPWVEGSSASNGAAWIDPNGTGTAGVWAAGSFSDADYDSTVSYGSYSAPFVSGQTLEFDVTDLVRAWRAGTIVNNGVVLIASGTDTGDLQFRSSEGNAAATPGPRLVIAYSQSGSSSGVTVRDEFGSASYVNNNGTRNWAGGWIETGDGGSPSGGSIRITGGVLEIKDDKAMSIYRAANLAGASSATLAYNLTARTLDNALDVIKLQGSTNGGTSWTDLQTFTNTTTVGSFSHDLVAALGGVTKDTRIRFVRISSTGGSKLIRVDNVTITYSTPVGGNTSTSLLADTALLSGTRNVAVTMKITSSAAGVVTPPTNLTVTATGAAGATKVSGPTPASATADLEGATFTYVYQVTSGAGIGSVRFSGTPTGPAGFTFVNGQSQSVLTTAPLAFTAKVNNPAPNPGPIVNTGTITANSGAISYNSNTVRTATSGTIGDLVWIDTNNNGAFNAGEPGLSGVRVYLDSNDNGLFDGGEPSAITDDQGAYRIFNVAPGTYFVRMDATTLPTGYAPTTATTVSPTLTTGQQFNDADFGLGAPSSSPGAIGDTLWIDPNENGVVDPGENLLPNITVLLYLDANNDGAIDGGDLVVDSESTDASGQYAFTAVNPGNYLVRVDTADPDFPAGLVLVSGGANGNGLHDVALALGQNYTAADFGFNYNASIGDFVWWDLNKNGLYEPGLGETPIENARVQLYRDADNNGIFDYNDPEIARVFTAASGTYLLQKLSPGLYFVDVYEDSITTNGIRNIVPTTGNIVTVNLGAGQEFLNADFGYYEGAIVEGIVYHDNNRNQFRELGESLLQNITVTLAGFDDFNNPVSLSTTTDSSGQFTFLVPAGNYTITYNTAQTTVAGYPDATTPVTLSIRADAGEDNTGFYQFGVDYSGSVGDTVFNDANGNGAQNSGEAGLSGVTVRLYSDAGYTNLLSVQATNALGQYLFNGLQDGAYYVQVDIATLPANFNTIPTADPDALKDSQGTAVVSGGVAVLTMDFGYQYVPPTYSVSGTVYDDNGAGGGIAGNGAQTGSEPGIANVTVQAFVDTNNDNSTDYVLTTTTNGSGFYSFAGIVQNSNVRIQINTSTLPSAGYGQSGDPDGTKDNQTTITNLTANVANRDFGYREVLASIAGTVVRDANGNGVAEVGETVVSSVPISLRYAGVDGIPGNGDDVITNTITDANGAYQFTGLLPGLYQVTKTNPSGYHSQADRDGGNPTIIELIIAPGDPVSGIGDVRTGQDFEITTAALGDYVWLDLNGNGVQEVNELPLTGVRVFVDSIANGVYDLGEPTAVTDSAGAYLISGIAPGTHTVRVSNLPGGVTPTFDPDGVGTANVATITLAANQILANVDWGYQGTGSIGDYVWNDRNGNGQQDADEYPLPGVKVFIDRNANGTWESDEPSATTNAAGIYSITGLSAGSYLIVVDTSTLPTGVVQTGDPDGAVMDGKTTVNLAAGQAFTGADFGYQGNASIGDYVWNDMNGDGLQNVTEPPLANVRVFLDRNSNGSYDANEPFALTSAGGTYAITGLVPGTYTVVIDTTSVLSGLSQTGDPDGLVMDGKTTVNLSAGQAFSAADFGYQGDSGIGDFVWYDVNGDAVQDPGEPGLQNVTVYLDLNDNGSAESGEPSVTTSATGAYGFTGLASGSYIVRIAPATLPGGLSASFDKDGIATVHRSVVTLPAATSVTDADFGYEGNATVNGHLYMDTNGNGTQDPGEPNLANVDVIITDALAVTRTVTADANGNWTVTVVAGTMSANIDESDPEYPTGYTQTEGTDPTNVLAVAGTSTSAGNDGFFLPASINGFVRIDTDGNATGDAPQVGVLVELFTNADVLVSSDLTETDGSYSFPNLAPGSYKVVQTVPNNYIAVSDADGGDFTVIGNLAPIVLNAGDALVDRNFVNSQSASITGTVFNDANRLADNTVNGTGTNGGGIHINLVNPVGDIVLASIPVNADGTYLFASNEGVQINSSYRLILTTNPVTVGSTLTTSTLPTPWFSTGENLGAGAGSDGTVDGILAVSTTVGALMQANFGIVQAPDVTPVITAQPNVMNGSTDFNVRVQVVELHQVNTEGTITVRIPKDARWTLREPYDSNLILLDGVPMENNKWAFSENATQYIFTTVNPSIVIPGGGFSSFGIKARWSTVAQEGVYTITSQIDSFSGKEIPINNNSDADKIDFFNN